MTELLLHPKTDQQISRLLSKPPQALLIIGKPGSGKQTTAEKIASELLKTDKLDHHPYFMAVPADEPTIGIDAIRNLKQFLKLKVAGKPLKVNRVILIHQAQRMTTEAQNSLLKTLEEPPVGTVIILTATSPEELLPTILSRSEQVQILPVSDEIAQTYLQANQLESGNLAANLALSGGAAGLLHTLISGQSDDLVKAVELGKQILGEKPAERLLRVDGLAKDKAQISQLLDGLQRICHAALTSAAKKNTVPTLKQWNKRQAIVLRSIKAHQSNANTKLLLDNLFLQI